jgi:hypothetical protein
MREDGQASVELVAVLPLLALVAALLWQAVVAGQALWLAGAAARAAARAAAVDADAERAARASLPPALEDGLRVGVGRDGSVSVRVRVPAVVVGGSLGAVTRHASFPGQAR